MLEASQTNPQSILAGDLDVTNGAPGNDGLCFLSANQPVGWTKEMHQHAGNVVLGDGSVQQVDSASLQELLRNSGLATNRLAIP